MPPKKADLKRAADALDEALNESPVRKKKSKTNINQQNVAIPEQIAPVPDIIQPDPKFIERFEPETALRLTKAENSIDFADDKVNFYSDLLTTFDNYANDHAVATAGRANAKIVKWAAYRDLVQASMDALMKQAPKKKANAMLNTDVAGGFLSSSG
jgi:hypothetical protein